jgi:hypothetical protein
VGDGKKSQAQQDVCDFTRGRIRPAAAGLNGQPMIRPSSLLLRIGVFVGFHVGVVLGVLALL